MYSTGSITFMIGKENAFNPESLESIAKFKKLQFEIKPSGRTPLHYQFVCNVRGHSQDVDSFLREAKKITDALL